MFSKFVWVFFLFTPGNVKIINLELAGKEGCRYECYNKEK